MRHESNQHQFSQIPHAEIPRSTFNRSHGHKTTFYSGFLVPIFADEALPGDTWNLKASIFARLSTPIVPVMDNLHMETFWFAVPNRLVWDNWQRFCGEQRDPGDSTDYLVPVITAPPQGFAEHSIFDYFGIPVAIANLTPTALHARAYNLIWNEWFRDQNLQPSLDVPRTDGPDIGSAYVLKKRGKRHDYFTSCLPWPQKGPGVELPLGTSAPVASLIQTGTPSVKTPDGVYHDLSSGGSSVGIGALTLTEGVGLIADLTNATAATINSLRQAFQIQKLLERDARGGTRYVEILKAHFGVTSPDSRLQRPEFLGGGHINIKINPVAQTSGTPGTGGYTTTPQGNLAAYGIAAGTPGGFTKSFTEHCIIIGLVCVRADLAYQQGLNRMWSRRTRFDYFWPAFSHIGEQAVLNKEIYAQGTAQDEEVFGYQERWAEYRYSPSLVTGQMRSQAPLSLDVWHLAQDFTTLPTLSAAFIEENPPVNRMLADQVEPDFIFDSYFAVKCTRPMPTYSTPGLIDHF